MDPQVAFFLWAVFLGTVVYAHPEEVPQSDVSAIDPLIDLATGVLQPDAATEPILPKDKDPVAKVPTEIKEPVNVDVAPIWTNPKPTDYANDVAPLKPVSFEEMDAAFKTMHTKGGKISGEEMRKVNSNLGDSTYGEMTPAGVTKVIEEIKPTEEDVFFDLGCGLGKMPYQWHLSTKVKKVVGVELSDTRYARAVNAAEQFASMGWTDPTRQLEYRKENIVDTDISDATILFMSSTCFGPELMDALQARWPTLRPGTRVLSLKSFKETDTLKLLQEMPVVTSWSSGSPLKIYKVVEPNSEL